MNSLRPIALVVAVTALAAGCSRNHAVTSPNGADMSRSTTDGWERLDNLDAWRGYETDAVPRGWTLQDNVISKRRSVGDLMTKKEYGDFELALEWKISPGGNSGIFYRGTTEYDHIYWSAPEYQLLDNLGADDNKYPDRLAASDYALYPAASGKVPTADKWNAARIIVNGAHVEHWLNGEKVVEYELWSPDWKRRVAASKFSAYPNYGMAKRGHIGIQGDHDGSLEIRNIRIRELP